MKNRIIFILIIVAYSIIPGFLHGAIPASERAALIALYNATNGDDWCINGGWKSPPLEPDGFAAIGSEGTWDGITVYEDHVVQIWLCEFCLSGTIPSELGNLDYLEYLELSFNDLTGPIPPEMGNLSSLEELYLGSNKLDGAIPLALTNLNNLVILSLGGNQLSGNIPSELGNMTNVKGVYLDGNQLSGNIPPELGNMTNLTSLSLGRNQLSGSIPSELGKLTHLIDLLLNYNQLSGNIPQQLGNLAQLEWFELDHNQLTSIPPEMGNLGNLYWCSLGHNQLVTIPPELGNIATLVYLFLNDNQLTSIPSELGNLKSLEYLYLENNQLNSIPPELQNLSNLEQLYLNNNRLAGNIPPELGNLSSLRSLALNDNQLTGNIPADLEHLSNLWSLYLNGNQLTGDIPTNITNMESLNTLKIGYNGLYATDESLQEFLANRQWDWELTQTIAPSEISVVPTSSSSFTVSWAPILYTGDAGAYYIYYSTTPGGTRTFAGKTSDKTVSSFTVTGLNPGTAYYFVIKTQTDPHTNNANTVTSEESEETVSAIGSVGPFGSFDTPLTGSTVCSSIPVTGWALDDLGVASVEIYRDGEKGEKVYIGNADFVEGARPDIAQAYPGYPNNQRAGWGYMMLTNFLPNGGNGTFSLYAIATDIEGNQTTLGTKIIICDNAHAVKPFGAIDTPAQGGTASGSSYRNNGWVLTPMPNEIPVEGSTINVFVDGVYLGHPVYNVYRSDISGLFPDYANNSGAGAYFDLDTTVYSNGVHTIYWTAEDDAGNADGIGSRYFVIQNANAGRGASAWHPASVWCPTSAWRSNTSGLRGLPDISNIPVDYSSPVLVKCGYNLHAEPVEIYPNDNGIITIEITELERIEIELVPEAARGLAPLYSTVPLPIGSTLDTENGIFYWSPGPGFIGTYRFVFVKKAAEDVQLKYINVNVRSKGNRGNKGIER